MAFSIGVRHGTRPLWRRHLSSGGRPPRGQGRAGGSGGSEPRRGHAGRGGRPTGRGGKPSGRGGRSWSKAHVQRDFSDPSLDYLSGSHSIAAALYSGSRQRTTLMLQNDVTNHFEGLDSELVLSKAKANDPHLRVRYVSKDYLVRSLACRVDITHASFVCLSHWSLFVPLTLCVNVCVLACSKA